MQPPNLPRRHGVHRGGSVQHPQHRRDADTSADEHDGRRSGRQSERTARSANLHVTANTNALVQKTACEAVLILDPNSIVWISGWTAQRIVPRNGGSIRVRLHPDHDVPWPGNACGSGKPSSAANSNDRTSLLSSREATTTSARKPRHARGADAPGPRPAFPVVPPASAASASRCIEARHPGLSAGMRAARRKASSGCSAE